LETLDPPARAFELGTMSDAAKRGEEIFRGKGGCAGCHSGPFFTDGLVHAIGVPAASGDTDPGSPTEPGAFNTPMLRDVASTAPYMHNGSLASLHDVVVFYATRSVMAPIHLSAEDINDLVAYLEAL